MTTNKPKNWNMPVYDTGDDKYNLGIKYKEVTDTIPIRGTEYMNRVPENWNGILLSDLDYVTNGDSPLKLYLLKNGYALSGLKRRPERMHSYDPAHEIHDIISVFDIFEELFDKPKHTIQYGCSGGGTITIAMSEIHPDRIDGGIAACGATSPWMANTHLDGLFVLKVLLAPDLPIVDLPLDGEEIARVADSWQKVIKEAQQTKQGRARIALALTIGQWPAWGGPGEAPVVEPDSNDAAALQDSMYQSLLMLLPSQVTFGTTMLELSGRGQLKWNNGVDYHEFFENGNKQYKEVVAKLYEQADIELSEDIDRVNAFPRVIADANATKYWSAPGRTHLGKPRVPLLRIHTTGDGLVYPSMAQGYEDLVKQNGYDKLFRSMYVNRWGHCTFTLEEWITALDVLISRIESGNWPNTQPNTLNAQGMAKFPDGDMRVVEYDGVKKYNRTWIASIDDYKG